jgi:hypothetical protein
LIAKVPFQLLGTFVQLLGVLPAGSIVNDVLRLVEGLLSLVWMLTRDFLGLVGQVPQVITDTHHSSSVDVDHLCQ